MRTRIVTVVAILAGLLLAALAQFCALVLNSVGEGWGAPGLVSLLLFVGLPVGLVRLADRRSESIKGDVRLLLLAALADAFLLLESFSLEYNYFRRGLGMHPFVDVWLGLWLLWHMLPIATVAIKLRRMS
jgi:hypothetical protein